MDLTADGYTEVSRTWLVAARESWTLPVLGRGLRYVIQNTRELITGATPRLLCCGPQGWCGGLSCFARTATRRSFWASVPTVIRSLSSSPAASKYRTRIPEALRP